MNHNRRAGLRALLFWAASALAGLGQSPAPQDTAAQIKSDMATLRDICFHGKALDSLYGRMTDNYRTACQNTLANPSTATDPTRWVIQVTFADWLDQATISLPAVGVADSGRVVKVPASNKVPSLFVAGGFNYVIYQTRLLSGDAPIDSQGDQSDGRYQVASVFQGSNPSPAEVESSITGAPAGQSFPQDVKVRVVISYSLPDYRIDRIQIPDVFQIAKASAAAVPNDLANSPIVSNTPFTHHILQHVIIRQFLPDFNALWDGREHQNGANQDVQAAQGVTEVAIEMWGGDWAKLAQPNPRRWMTAQGLDFLLYRSFNMIDGAGDVYRIEGTDPRMRSFTMTIPITQRQIDDLIAKCADSTQYMTRTYVIYLLARVDGADFRPSPGIKYLDVHPESLVIAAQEIYHDNRTTITPINHWLDPVPVAEVSF